MKNCESESGLTVVKGFSIGGGIDLSLDGLRTASLEDLPLSSLENKGLAKRLGKVDGYTTVVWSGNGVFSPIEMLIGCFPHEGFPVAATLDELPVNTRQALRFALNGCVKNLFRVANEHDIDVGNVHIVQHIAPAETYHTRPHAQSFNQIHFHAFIDPITKSHGLEIIEGFEAQKLIRDKHDAYVFRDPTKYIARDIIMQVVPESILWKESSSVEILQSQTTSEITENDFDMLAHCMKVWKDEWRRIVQCYTDFTVDDHGRYIPILPNEATERIDSYVQSHAFLSEQSRKILYWLATHIKAAEWKSVNYWKIFYKGIAGSITISVDPKLRKSIYLVPRIRIAADRTVCAPCGNRIFMKDRGRRFSVGDEKELLHLQREAMQKF